MATDSSGGSVYEEAAPVAPNCTSLDFDSGTIYSNGHDIDVINNINNNNSAADFNNGRRSCFIVTSSSSPCRAPAGDDVTTVESTAEGGRVTEVKELSWNEKLMNNIRRQQNKEQRRAADSGKNKTTEKQKSVGNRLSGSISKIFGKLSSNRLSLPLGQRSASKQDDSVVNSSDCSNNVHGRRFTAESPGVEDDDEDNMWSDGEFDDTVTEDIYTNVNSSNSHLCPTADVINSQSRSMSPAHDVTVPMITPRVQHSTVAANVDSRSRNTVFSDVINCRSTATTTSHDELTDEDYLEPVAQSDNDVTSDDVISGHVDSDFGSQQSESEANRCQQLPPVIAKRFKVSSNGQLLTTTSNPAAVTPDTRPTPDTPDTAAAAAAAECDMSTGRRSVPQPPPPFTECYNSTSPPLPVRRATEGTPQCRLYPALPPAYSEHDPIQKPAPPPPVPVARNKMQTVTNISNTETSSRHSSTGSHNSSHSSATATVNSSNSSNNNNNNNNTGDDVYENPDAVMEDDVEYEQVDGPSSSCMSHPLPPPPPPLGSVSSVSPLATKPRCQSLGDVLVTDQRPAVKPKPTDKSRLSDSSAAGLSATVMGGVAVITGITPSDLVHAAGTLNSTGVNVKRPVTSQSNSCSPFLLQSNNNNNSSSSSSSRPRPPVAQRTSVSYINSSPGQVDDELDLFPWYFGSADRAQCETKIVAVGRDGTFVVRKRTPANQTSPYALTMSYGGATYNLLIRQKNNSKYALGSEKLDENIFGSVEELVSFYRNNPIQLTNDRTATNIIGKVRLTVSPNK